MNENQSITAVVIAELTKSYAFAGRDPLAPAVAIAFAAEAIEACSGIAAEQVSQIFEIARKKSMTPCIMHLLQAWESLRGKTIEERRIENAPYVVRWVAQKIWCSIGLVFEDSAMRDLCAQLGMGSAIAFPSPFMLANDKEIRNAYRGLSEHPSGKLTMYGHGNRKGSECKVPGAEKYKRKEISAEVNDEIKRLEALA